MYVSEQNPYFPFMAMYKYVIVLFEKTQASIKLANSMHEYKSLCLRLRSFLSNTTENNIEEPSMKYKI